MKQLTILSCILLQACMSTPKHIPIIILEEVPISFTINLEGDSFVFSFKNDSDTTFYIANPKHFINSYVCISKSEELVHRGIKINPNPGGLSEFIILPAQDSIEVEYNYKINNLYNINRETNYQLLVQWKGPIKDANGKYYRLQNEYFESDVVLE